MGWVRPAIGWVGLVVVSLTSGCSGGASVPVPPAAAAITWLSPAGPPTLLPELKASLASFAPGLRALDAGRKESLERVASFVRARRAAGSTAKVLFVSTDDARGSQLGQLWATAAAAYYGIDDVEAYSAGLRVTPVSARTMAALEGAGFRLATAGGEQAHVKVTYASDARAIEAFAKDLIDPVNPKQDFAAIVTCSRADEACPVVPGASVRVALPYEEPEIGDRTREEDATCEARSRQIATEMLFLFSRVLGDPLASRL